VGEGHSGYIMKAEKNRAKSKIRNGWISKIRDPQVNRNYSIQGEPMKTAIIIMLIRKRP
jgi:hypothetical protein